MANTPIIFQVMASFPLPTLIFISFLYMVAVQNQLTQPAKSMIRLNILPSIAIITRTMHIKITILQRNLHLQLPLLDDNAGYFDTRATHYIIANLNKLPVSSKYGGFDSVQVSDGQNLSNLHIGLSSISSYKKKFHLSNIFYYPRASTNILSLIFL